MKTPSSSGFTLVESIIAIFAFSVVFTAVASLVAEGVKTNTAINNELTAQYLANEGVEVIEAIRLDNYIAGRPFMDGFSVCTTGCAVDGSVYGYSEGSSPYFGVVACSALTDPCAQLYLTGSGAFQKMYGHKDGADSDITAFRRMVKITDESSAQDTGSYSVAVTVSWNVPGSPVREFEVIKVIKDWY